MKVAIVNDSKMAAEILRRIVAQLPEFTVAWTAYSGEEALSLCGQNVPDIILMDLVMPGIDGAETTRRIMQSWPCAILVVTATTAGNRNMVFEAMGNGALDAVNTPVLGSRQELDGADPLIQKLRVVSRLVRHADGSMSSGATVGGGGNLRASSEVPVVAIGASTGGPQALAHVLSHLPTGFGAAVLVVQHVDEQFTRGLATWLQNHAKMPVALAEQDARLSPGGIWLAGRSANLTYDHGFAKYTVGREDAVYKPSIDSLFYSLAKPHRVRRVGVLLTGMGRDGAAGLLAMRNSGAITIAQDAATSVVYGMPKAAAEINAASEVLPLSSIGPRICAAVMQQTNAKPEESGGHHVY